MAKEFLLESLILELSNNNFSKEAYYLHKNVKEDSDGNLIINDKVLSSREFFVFLKKEFNLKEFPVLVYIHMLETKNIEGLKALLDLTEDRVFYTPGKKCSDKKNGVFGKILREIDKKPYFIPDILGLMLLAHKAGNKIKYINFIGTIGNLKITKGEEKIRKIILLLNIIDKRSGSLTYEDIEVFYKQIFNQDFKKDNLKKAETWDKLNGASIDDIVDKITRDFLSGEKVNQSINEEIVSRLLDMMLALNSVKNIKFIAKKVENQIAMGGYYQYSDDIFEKLIQLEKRKIVTHLTEMIATSNKVIEIMNMGNKKCKTNFEEFFQGALIRDATNFAYSMINYMNLEGKDLSNFIEALSKKIENFDINDLVLIKDIIQGKYVDATGPRPIQRPERDIAYYKQRQKLKDFSQREKDVVEWYEKHGAKINFKGNKIFGLLAERTDKTMRMFALNQYTMKTGTNILQEQSGFIE